MLLIGKSNHGLARYAYAIRVLLYTVLWTSSPSSPSLLSGELLPAGTPNQMETLFTIKDGNTGNGTRVENFHTQLYKCMQNEAKVLLTF